MALLPLVHLVHLVCFVYLVYLVGLISLVSLVQSNEAPRSSLLRRSSHFGEVGWKLRGILRNSPTRRPEPLGGVPKPLPSFAPTSAKASVGRRSFSEDGKATEDSPRLAYSAEAAASAAKA